jgi:hypothetical protein
MPAHMVPYVHQHGWTEQYILGFETEVSIILSNCSYETAELGAERNPGHSLWNERRYLIHFEFLRPKNAAHYISMRATIVMAALTRPTPELEETFRNVGPLFLSNGSVAFV